MLHQEGQQKRWTLSSKVKLIDAIKFKSSVGENLVTLRTNISTNETMELYRAVRVVLARAGGGVSAAVTIKMRKEKKGFGRPAWASKELIRGLFRNTQ